MNPADPIGFTQALIRCASVTPKDDGALDLVENTLNGLGFSCTRLPFAEVDNLYAVFGTARPNFCFAGHTDVVPTGPLEQWSHDPFTPVHQGGKLYGRGASDMKTSIASFVVAVEEFLGSTPDPRVNIALLLTSDEEGPAVDGTVASGGVPMALTFSTRAPGDTTLGEATERMRIASGGNVGYVDANTGKVAWEYKFNNFQSDVPPHRIAWASPAVDPQTGNVYALGAGAMVLALSKDGTQAFIANEDTGQVSFVHLADGVVTHSVKVGDEPEGITVSPDGQQVWVTSEDAGAVYAVVALFDYLGWHDSGKAGLGIGLVIVYGLCILLPLLGHATMMIVQRVFTVALGLSVALLFVDLIGRSSLSATAGDALDLKTTLEMVAIGMGIAWAGGQALARYVLDNRQVALGRRVLDFAAGCGVGDVLAWDVGPGNMVLDGLMQRLTKGKETMDRGGKLAAKGKVAALASSPASRACSTVMPVTAISGSLNTTAGTASGA